MPGVPRDEHTRRYLHEGLVRLRDDDATEILLTIEADNCHCEGLERVTIGEEEQDRGGEGTLQPVLERAAEWYLVPGIGNDDPVEEAILVALALITSGVKNVIKRSCRNIFREGGVPPLSLLRRGS